jgi:hypothetical protein
LLPLFLAAGSKHCAHGTYLPDGFAIVAHATPMQTTKRVIDANASTKPTTVVLIGGPPP